MTLGKDWWRGAVIYQIYPRSYMDANADGIGDLPGITQKLDHIARLGADAIWISPFFKSPMVDFGYDVSDYCNVDPIFGTLDDFKHLVDKAHTLGIKVLIDQVWSHSSNLHPWFQESSKSKDNKKHDWYIWADPKPDGTAPNNWLSYFGGPAWTWCADREQYYLHQFLPNQPNLNLWNPDVRAAIKDVASFWLNLGVDGFRLDAIQTYLSDRDLRDNPPCPPWESIDIPSSNPMSRQKRIYTSNLRENYALIEEIRNHVNKWDGKCLLAEVGGEDSIRESARYTRTGKLSHLAYSFGLIGSLLTKGDILNVVNQVESVVDDGWICWATSNHDYKRVASRPAWDCPPEQKAKLAIAIGLSLRGSYCMYQGEELGLPQADLAFEDLVDPYDIALYPHHVGRDGCRTPMPWDGNKKNAGFSEVNGKTWLPIPKEHSVLSVANQERDNTSVLEFTRKFLSWRKSKAEMTIGDINILETSNDSLLAFERRLGDQTTLCVFNLGNEKVSFTPSNHRGFELNGYSFICGDFRED